MGEVVDFRPKAQQAGAAGDLAREGTVVVEQVFTTDGKFFMDVGTDVGDMRRRMARLQTNDPARLLWLVRVTSHITQMLVDPVDDEPRRV